MQHEYVHKHAEASVNLMQNLTQVYLGCQNVLDDPKQLILPFKGVLQAWTGMSEAMCHMVSFGCRAPDFDCGLCFMALWL